MNTIKIVKEKAEYLKLETFNNSLDKMLANGFKIDLLKDIGFILDQEIEFRKQRAQKIGLKVANFPFVKTLNDFDFQFQKDVKQSQVSLLSTLNFIANNENIIFIGTPGVGKTHLSVALGIEAIKNKRSTYFIHCHKLLATLKKAYLENRLPNRLKKFASYKVLIIDEIGFIPFDDLAGKLLFQLINLRYPKHPTIITTNLPLEKWNKLFKDPVLGMALLDRLLERSHVITIVGKSYRTKNIYNEKEGGKSPT